MVSVPDALQTHTMRHDAACDVKGRGPQVVDTGCAGVALAGADGLSATDPEGLRTAGGRVGIEQPGGRGIA
jgi:hypothetical protein